MYQEFQKNNRVRFIRKPTDPKLFLHFESAKEYIDLGKVYTVEHVFVGSPEQLELKGISTILFASEMFDLIED